MGLTARCDPARKQTMTEQNQSERTRRTFMKGAAATGVAATGITAFSGSAAGQQNPVNVDASQLEIGDQDGEQVATGLINVQVQNAVVAIQDVISVQIGRSVIENLNVEVLNDNEVNIALDDVVNVQGNNIAVIVNILGETTSGQVSEFRGVDRTEITQSN